MALKAEECPVTKDDGGGGLMKTVVEAVVRPRDLEKDRHGGKENVNVFSSGSQGPIEVDSEEDQEDEDVYVAFKRPFTRSAAVAAAAARARIGSSRNRWKPVERPYE
jgi:hypothetical protein